MIRKYAEIFCWKNVSSFCSAKATHIFSAKNIRRLYIESAKTVNEMTLNELVKLTTLWTTGPRSVIKFLLSTFFKGCKKVFLKPAYPSSGSYFSFLHIAKTLPILFFYTDPVCIGAHVGVGVPIWADWASYMALRLIPVYTEVISVYKISCQLVKSVVLS